MSSKEMLNVAIVGYGLAGATFHAPLVKSTAGLKVAAVVARSQEKQERVRRDFPEAKIISDVNQLVEDAKHIDLVVIATPNKEHVPQAIQCMKAGLHVVVDKPIAVNTKECEQLIEVSQQTGTLLSVFQNRRWDNDFLTVKKLVSEGRLGKILRFESRFERYRPTARAGAWRETIGADEGGGLLFDLGSHLIDQATQLFGQPDQVYAEVEVRREGVNADDDCFVALSFPSGVKAHIWASAITASGGHRFRVLGTTGAYEKYGLDPQEDALRVGKTPLDKGWGVEAAGHFGRLTEYENGEKIERALETVPGMYQFFYEKMRDALNGTANVPVDPREALNTMRIIETARASAQRKTVLSVSHS